MKQYHSFFSVVCMFFLLMYGMFFCTGCGKKESGDFLEQGEEEQEIENPFAELENDPETEVTASYGYTITNYDKDKRVVDNYNGGDLQFDFTFHNEGAETEVGIMVFIDGVAQQIREKDREASACILPVTMQEKTECSLSICLTPVFGAKAKEHGLNFVCIYMPSYRDQGQGMGQAVGNYHHALPMLTWKLIYDYQGELPAVSRSVTMEKITKKKKKDYFDFPENQELNSLYAFLVQDGNRVRQYLDFSDGGKQDAELVLMGGGTCTYRLSAFINHVPAAVFDGKEYVDMEVKEYKLSMTELDFSSIQEQLMENDVFYVIATPLSLDSKFIQEKTDSVSIRFYAEQEKESTGNSSDGKLKEENNKEENNPEKEQGIEELIADTVKKKRLLWAEPAGDDVFMLLIQDKKQTLEAAFINKKTKKLLSKWQDDRLGSVPQIAVVGSVPMLYDKAGNVFLLDQDYQIRQELKLSELLKEELTMTSDGEKRNYCVLPEKKKILWVQADFEHGVVYNIYSIGFHGKGKKRIARIYGPEKDLHNLNGINYLYNSTDENSFYFSGFYYDSREFGAESLHCFGRFDLKKKKWEVYHQEKPMAAAGGDAMVFYDMAPAFGEESSGEICLLDQNGQKTITLKHKNESSAVYPAGDGNDLYTCHVVYGKELAKPSEITIRKYSLPDGACLGSCQTGHVPYHIIGIGQEEFLSFYYDDNGNLLYKRLRITGGE